MFIEDTNCIIIEIKIGLTIINEILLVIEEQEKNKDEIIEELKQKIKLLENKLKEKENKKLKNFKIEKINNIINLKFNKGTIFCLKILDDGRLAAGDSNSNLIIYKRNI